MGDIVTGLIHLAADANWRSAPLPVRLAVLAFGRRETVHHLGRRFRLGWLWGVPYLIAVSEDR